MEVLDRPAQANTLAEELSRFQGVVAKRRFPSEFIALFTKLQESTMFSEEMKPAGFAYLLEMSVTKVPDHFFGKLMDAISESNAVHCLFGSRGRMAEDDFKGVVRRWLELTPMEADPQLEVFLSLERMGISEERGATLDMALRAGLDPSTVDRICDLTFAGYYPSFAEAHPLPTATPRSPFNDAESI